MDEVYEKLGISEETLLNHYFEGNDRTVSESWDNRADEMVAEVCQYKNTCWYYLVVACNALPGWRIKNIWNGTADI